MTEITIDICSVIIGRGPARTIVSRRRSGQSAFAVRACGECVASSGPGLDGGVPRDPTLTPTRLSSAACDSSTPLCARGGLAANSTRRCSACGPLMVQLTRAASATPFAPRPQRATACRSSAGLSLKPFGWLCRSVLEFGAHPHTEFPPSATRLRTALYYSLTVSPSRLSRGPVRPHNTLASSNSPVVPSLRVCHCLLRGLARPGSGASSISTMRGLVAGCHTLANTMAPT